MVGDSFSRNSLVGRVPVGADEPAVLRSTPAQEPDRLKRRELNQSKNDFGRHCDASLIVSPCARRNAKLPGQLLHAASTEEIYAHLVQPLRERPGVLGGS